MGAHVDFEFKRDFMIDEERLRSIHNIIYDRMDKEYKLKPVYMIYCTDNYVYTTDSIEDILKEENNEFKKITRLKIIPEQNTNNFKFTLEFNSKQTYDIEATTTLKVEGEDRDFVFLFFSDLKTYLISEVNTRRKISLKILGLIRILPLFSILIIPSYFLFDNNVFERDIALNTQDINIKLNYIINNIAIKGFSNYRTLYYLLIPVLILISYSESFSITLNKVISQYLYPSNLFLFGKELTRFNKILDLRSKIIWGEIVTLIISVLASLIVFKLTV